MGDLFDQLTKKAENQAEIKKTFGMMISMVLNDKTFTCIIVKPTSSKRVVRISLPFLEIKESTGRLIANT